jgi:hypothetical protein
MVHKRLGSITLADMVDRQAEITAEPMMYHI